jgi:hypothetical protein
MKLTFSGSISETIIFDPTSEVVRANFDAVEDLVRRLDARHDPRPEGAGPPSLIWWGVDGDLVADFLNEFRTHKHAAKAQSSVMAKYIRARVVDEVPELTDWTVALLSNPGEPVPIGGHEIGRTKRAYFPPGEKSKDVYAIRRLLSPADEAIDLSGDERDRAKQITTEWWEKGIIRSKSVTAPTQANGRAIREVRPPTRGLLMLYALDEAEAEGVPTGTPIIGLAVSFPVSHGTGAGAIEYVVNNIYSQLELELE